MIMPDKSITFRRVVVINDSNGIDVNFRITNTRSMFGVEEYPSLRDFYQKMYEMMNEPIVLKKGT